MGFYSGEIFACGLWLGPEWRVARPSDSKTGCGSGESSGGGLRRC